MPIFLRLDMIISRKEARVSFSMRRKFYGGRDAWHSSMLRWDSSSLEITKDRFILPVKREKILYREHIENLMRPTVQTVDR